MKKNKPSAGALFGVAVLLMTFSCRAQEARQDPPPAAAPAAQPEQPKAQEPSLDKFEGELGHFEKAEAFAKFVSDHTLKPVYIDARLIPGPMDDEGDFKITNDTFGVDSFVLWESCDSLKDGEKPSVGACTGTEYSLDRSEGPKDSDLTFIRGTLSLKGYFVVKGCDGPHQGLMGCTLRPVNTEAVL